MAKIGMRGRIEKLVQYIVRANDEKILAWGATVTEEGLREITAMPPDGTGRRMTRTEATTISDADLWRIVMPAIQAHRMASFTGTGRP